ncbi:MAG: glycerol-3-phosphate dehydrogenase C-terminal domain-containing protein, partial [Agromyces sp.]
STAGLAIGGGAGYPTTDDARRVWTVTHGDEVGRLRAEELLERYGTRAEAFIASTEGERDEPLAHHTGYSRREIAWLARTERVVHLSDIVLRRTSIAFTGALTAPLLDELAEVVGAELGWDFERRAVEMASTRELLAERHGVELEASATLV